MRIAIAGAGNAGATPLTASILLREAREHAILSGISDAAPSCWPPGDAVRPAMHEAGRDVMSAERPHHLSPHRRCRPRRHCKPAVRPLFFLMGFKTSIQDVSTNGC